jgi:hypothetical protein
VRGRGLQGARAPSGWLRRRAGDEAGAPWLDQGRGGVGPRRAGAAPEGRVQAAPGSRARTPGPRARAAVSGPHPRAGRAIRPRARQAGHRAAALVPRQATTPGSQAGAAPEGRERGGGRPGVEVGEEGQGDWRLREVRIVGENQGRAVREEEEEVGAPDRRARRLGRLGEGAP